MYDVIEIHSIILLRKPNYKHNVSIFPNSFSVFFFFFSLYGRFSISAFIWVIWVKQMVTGPTSVFFPSTRDSNLASRCQFFFFLFFVKREIIVCVKGTLEAAACRLQSCPADQYPKISVGFVSEDFQSFPHFKWFLWNLIKNYMN